MELFSTKVEPRTLGQAKSQGPQLPCVQESPDRFPFVDMIQAGLLENSPQFLSGASVHRCQELQFLSRVRRAQDVS